MDKVSTSHELTILMKYEKEVVESLESADLMKLCEEAVEMRVVPQHVKKNLDSMDKNVPRPRVIRYLLMHMYRNIKENPRLYFRLLDLLHKHLSSANVLDMIQFELLKTSPPSPVSTCTMSLAEGISDVLGSTQLCSKPQDAILERHIPQLTELLVGCAHKWENISIALGLPERVRKDLRAKQDSDCVFYFSQVLTRWVLDRYEHARPPTLGNLAAVLKTQQVGLAIEAEKLNDIDVDEFSTQEKWTPLPKKPRLDPLPVEIVQQSCDTTVSENKSTLLEVQAVTSRDVNVSYKWLKDERELDGDSHGSILCISCASISSKGTYKCEVSISGDSPTLSTISAPIKLTVSLSVITSTLVTRYLSEPEVPKDSWPPANSSTYIHLALIKQGDIDKAGEYGRNTVQGSVDDILADKENIEYENTFTNLKSATRLLIEGRPGSGKTTLVHKFSQDWARGNSQLNLRNHKLLFLVHLRGFFNDHSVSLQDIVQLYYKQPYVDTIVKQAEESCGEGFCFILDGLDEYRPKSFKKTFIYNLIERQELPAAVVIIASRPAASHQFRTTASKQVEVIGFMREQILEYIEVYPFSNPDKKGDLCKYLEHHPNVHHMCYLPIHAAMVCYLFNIMGSTLPRTETEMYTAFTHLTLFRTIKRDEESELEHLESVSDLSEQEQDIFSRICKLSYEKTLSSKQVMKRSEVKDFFTDINCGGESMGLITVDRMSKMCGFENLYTFLHLTFQEYLAAYYLFKYSRDKLKKLQKHGKKKHMQVVWKFYCGLEHFSEKDARLPSLFESANGKRNSLFSVQCAFESQQLIVCDYVVESGEHGTLSFKEQFLTASDLTAIGYVIKASTCPVEKLVLDRCKFSREGVDAFLEEAGDKILSVKTLCFHGRACRVEQFVLLNSCLERMTSLETLDLSDTKIGERKICSLTANITLPNLHTLKVSPSSFLTKKSLQQLHFNSSKVDIFINEHLLKSNEKEPLNSFCVFGMQKQVNISRKLSVEDISSLATGLKRSGSCTSLALVHCRVDDDGAKALGEGLQHCNNLQTLNLNYNYIGADGTKALGESLQHCNNLQTLNLYSNNIGDDGVKALGESLQHCNNLQTLNLYSNNIGDDGAKALGESLQHCNNLQTLDLYSNNIGADGAKALGESLQHCNNLQTLNLDYNNIGDDGAKALGECLQHWNNLQTLKLKRNNIGDDGAKALGESLQHCNNLQTLDLYGNNIGDDGAKALGESLQHCNNLQTLDLYGNNIGADGAKALGEGLQHCNNLQTLDLNSNNIGDDGAKALGEGLQHCNNLQTLDLYGNNIGADGAKALGEGLQHCNNLQTLDLNSNNIGADGAKALGEGLQHCNNLQTLNLDYNNISDDGAKALGECLQHWNNLQTLKLKRNNIGADGAKALGEGLQHCNNLQTLDLYSNNIGADGAKALGESLQHCNNLQTLNLDYNNIGDDGAKALGESLRHCNNLQTLDFSYNNIGADGAKALCGSLQHCNDLRVSYSI